MAMLKSKVKSFLVGLQKERVHNESAIKSSDIHQMQPTDLPHSRDDPKKTDEVIDEIEDHYFDEGDVDCIQYELESLDSETNMASLEERIFCLKMRDTAVYRKIYDLVFSNYTAYVQELENVTMLQVSLQDAARTCVHARRSLKAAQEGVSLGGLGLLGKYQRRARLNSLLDILRALKTLQRTDAKLKTLLEEGDYPAATQLCIECQRAIEIYKHFFCVSELSVSLQDIQHDIEQELETALANVTMKFNSHNYKQVQQAYNSLGKSETAVDILMMKFTTTIHDEAYSIVAYYVKKSGKPVTDIHVKSPYANICKMVEAECFIPCLMDMCQVFWKIIFCFREVKSWHSHNEAETQSDNFNKTYVRTKLENGQLRVWRDVQQKLRPYILALDMSHFKYDDFIRVLDIVNSLISIGVEFCGEGSESLQESMRQQSLNYFWNYHRTRLEELKIFLETEAWELCPVRSTFSLHQLREFRFLKSVTSPKAISQKESQSCFKHFSLDGNPFASLDETEEEAEEIIDTRTMEDTYSDDEEEDFHGDEDGRGIHSISRGIRQQNRSSNATKGPLLANTTLSVLRLFGNYMQMMNVLKPIAFDVFECLSQLFDYYLFGVYHFFVQDLECLPENIPLSTKLSTSLKRISESCFIEPEELRNVSYAPAENQVKVLRPVVNPVVPLNKDSLFGLSCRMVAVESLVHLSEQFGVLLPYIENMIPQSKMSFLKQFVSQTVQTVSELRKPLYHGIAIKALPFDQILQGMTSVKWDIREIKSQHSPYVDSLIQEFVKYHKLLLTIDRKVRAPPEVHHTLWEGAILAANRMFVEGFSGAKKCTNEGRALMQLDYQQYRTKVEKISNIRPLPSHGHVEDYIKAYYLSEEDTIHWLNNHAEYTSKQLQSLVVTGVGSRGTKRSKQRLLSVIDELEKRK